MLLLNDNKRNILQLTEKIQAKWMKLSIYTQYKYYFKNDPAPPKTGRLLTNNFT